MCIPNMLRAPALRVSALAGERLGVVLGLQIRRQHSQKLDAPSARMRDSVVVRLFAIVLEGNDCLYFSVS